jgi:glycosyltransferase 2 family protein
MHTPPKPKPLPRWRRALPLIGIVLLCVVLSRLDMREMGRALSRVSLATLAFASAAFTLNLFLKAFRWQRLLQTQGLQLPTRVALAAFLSGQFYAQVTLGRAGEFLRIEALLERGVSAGSALASCIFDRLLDVFAVLLAGCVLAALVLGNRQLALLALLLMVAGGVGVALLIRLLGVPVGAEQENRASRWAARAQGPGLFGRLAKLLVDLARGMRPMLSTRSLSEMAAWTIVSWLGYFAALWQLAEGLHVHVSRSLLTSTASFAALSALLPITVSGLGARELIYINVLRSHGVPSESAVVLSLLHLFVMSASATGFGFLGVLWRQQQSRP